MFYVLYLYIAFIFNYSHVRQDFRSNLHTLYIWGLVYVRTIAEKVGGGSQTETFLNLPFHPNMLDSNPNSNQTTLLQNRILTTLPHSPNNNRNHPPLQILNVSTLPHPTPPKKALHFLGGTAIKNIWAIMVNPAHFTSVNPIICSSVTGCSATRMFYKQYNCNGNVWIEKYYQK